MFGKNKWKKRWCVLSDGQFFYYSSREAWVKETEKRKRKGGHTTTNKPPFELIDCAVLPAEGDEEGDVPDPEWMEGWQGE